jgi:1-acyl-sn-glycerol-3-phosphate acyltransferase
MKSQIPGSLKGILSIFAWTVNTVPRFCILAIAGLLKLAIPIPWCRKVLTILIIWIAENWVKWNGFIYDTLYDIKWNIQGLDQLKKEGWYLVISNHQTWIDIPVLQTIFHQKIPFLKFFLKKDLIWVPVMGVCWWALDFPFMKRYSAEYLKKKPHMKGKDIEITQKACAKFKTTPVSIMNYVE